MAVFLMPAFAATPLGQLDSFDDIGGEWDVEPYRSFDPNLNLIDYEAVTLWVKSDPDGAYLKQIILYDDANSRIGRYDVPAASTPSWRKVTAPLASFVWTGGSSTTIDRIGLWTSCSGTVSPPDANDIYLDDLRVSEPNDQLDSLDDVNAAGWTDDRGTGLMLQEATEKVEGTGSMKIKYTSRKAGWNDGRATGWMQQEVNDVNKVHEGTGSMKMAFTLWASGNVDVEPTRVFSPALDFNDYKNLAITLWVWSDRSNSEFREIILYDNDDPPHNGRFVAHPPDSNGWTKVVANMAAFSWYAGAIPVSPDDANWNSIREIGLFSSCGTSNNHDIYLDDLRLDSYQVTLSQATIVNADRTFGTITVDGNAADWATLDDSDVVDFNLAAVPDQPKGNLHVKYRLAWDPDYLYILVQEQPGDTLAKEANQVGGMGLDWSLNDSTGGDAYYDALALYFDFTNIHPILGGREGISLWLYLGLNSKGSTDMMMAWTNATWAQHDSVAIANGMARTSGTLGSRITEAKVKWSDLDSAINYWLLPEGGLAAAVKPGYIFGCNPRLNDFEKSTLWGNFTVEKGTAWLNGKLWDWQGTPSATGIYAKDVRLVCSAADLNFDCDVNFKDYAQFAEKWANDGCNNLNGFCNGADIVIDGTVNMIDLAKFAQEWLSE